MDERDNVRTDLSAEEQALQSQVRESEGELEGLEQELHAVDAELSELAAQSRKFEALGDVCRSLEQLEDLGGTQLFWTRETDEVTESIESARCRIHDFGERFINVEKRRDAIMNRIGKQNYALDCLHYELLDAMELVVDNFDANYGITWETIEAALDAIVWNQKQDLE